MLDPAFLGHVGSAAQWLFKFIYTNLELRPKSGPDQGPIGERIRRIYSALRNTYNPMVAVSKKSSRQSRHPFQTPKINFYPWIASNAALISSSNFFQLNREHFPHRTPLCIICLSSQDLHVISSALQYHSRSKPLLRTPLINNNSGTLTILFVFSYV